MPDMREGKPAADAFVENIRRVLNPLPETKRKP